MDIRRGQVITFDGARTVNSSGISLSFVSKSRSEEFPQIKLFLPPPSNPSSLRQSKVSWNCKPAKRKNDWPGKRKCHWKKEGKKTLKNTSKYQQIKYNLMKYFLMSVSVSVPDICLGLNMTLFKYKCFSANICFFSVGFVFQFQISFLNARSHCHHFGSIIMVQQCMNGRWWFFFISLLCR